MKPDSRFVLSILALCSVTQAHLVHKDAIKADHVRLMDQCMTSEAKELIQELTGDADEKMEECNCGKTEAFVKSGLADLTKDERVLVCCIYGSQGREIKINDSGMTVFPSQKVLSEKRRLGLSSKNSQQQVA